MTYRQYRKLWSLFHGVRALRARCKGAPEGSVEARMVPHLIEAGGKLVDAINVAEAGWYLEWQKSPEAAAVLRREFLIKDYRRFAREHGKRAARRAFPELFSKEKGEQRG
jgi:hypothetical protein